MERMPDLRHHRIRTGAERVGDWRAQQASEDLAYALLQGNRAGVTLLLAEGVDVHRLVELRQRYRDEFTEQCESIWLTPAEIAAAMGDTWALSAMLEAGRALDATHAFVALAYDQAASAAIIQQRMEPATADAQAA